MFDWSLFLCLILVSAPGILLVTPGTIETLRAQVIPRLPAGKKMPPAFVMTVVSMLQSLLLMAGVVALGTALAPKAGLSAPFFEALAAGEPLWKAVRPQLVPAAVLGVGGALVIVAAYYMFFRPRLDPETVSAMEGLRMRLGLSGRILYGGIVEEVLFRWGVMTFGVWLGTLFTGTPSGALVWVVILLSGLLFGIGHLPSYKMAGCVTTPMFLALMLVLNLWATVICGWLFWQYGLLAAMLAHMLYHLVWYPFDVRLYKVVDHSARA
jgi:hypothetical protein